MKKHYLKPSLHIVTLKPQPLLGASDGKSVFSISGSGFSYEGSDENYDEGAR